ncbi:MAG: BtaA family protein [Acidobacteriota bacterium]|nr:BtaA family protein [Acidobacteriota bacterium]
MGNSMARQAVRAAVSQKSASKRQSLMQRLFAIWFDAFVYNQIWEDPRVDIEALKLDESSRILTISSGGCNALNYLLEDPASVTAVDLNKNHIFLLNLKKAAIENLSEYEDFFEFFGAGKGPGTIHNYKTFIASKLDAETLSFWESGSLFGRVLTGKRIEYFRRGGLYEHSRNGYFLRVFHRLSKMLGCPPEEILKALDRDDQERRYEKYIEPFFDSLIIRAVGKLPVTLFGLGIPPQQFAELKKDIGENGSIVDIYRERAKKLAVGYPIEDNYFAWQAFGRKYDTQNRKAVPEYLKAENFATLKKNISRLRVGVGSVTDEIRNNEKGTFNRLVFLDAQDWMDTESLTELWELIADRAAKGSRVIFRTAGSASPLEGNLSTRLLSRFQYCDKESEAFFERDRASIYGGFHLYTVL